jgi:hypothetical protein
VTTELKLTPTGEATPNLAQVVPDFDPLIDIF